ncbi:hypothetical protein HG530_002772 [Fusarium avenaceum]|nr:hypothetical protein HG530_002772 [Fusarium avenaceum]
MYTYRGNAVVVESSIVTTATHSRQNSLRRIEPRIIQRWASTIPLREEDLLHSLNGNSLNLSGADDLSPGSRYRCVEIDVRNGLVDKLWQMVLNPFSTAHKSKFLGVPGG